NRAAGDSIDDIVVPVRAVINGVLAGAGDPAFQADDLRHQPIVARQHDATAVQKRQKIAIEIALGTLARFVSNAVLAEQLAGKFPGIVIAADLPHAVRSKQDGEVIDHGRWRKERSEFAHSIDDDLAAFGFVPDSAGEGIFATAGSRIDERAVSRARSWQHFAMIPNAAFDDGDIDVAFEIGAKLREI